MYKKSIGDRIFSIFVYGFLTLLGFSTFYPFWNGLVISLNDGMDTALGGVTFWPRKWSSKIITSCSGMTGS